MKFSQNMPPYFFYTMVQKAKNDQKLSLSLSLSLSVPLSPSLLVSLSISLW